MSIICKPIQHENRRGSRDHVLVGLGSTYLHGTKRPSAFTEVKHQPSHVNLPSDETDKTFIGGNDEKMQPREPLFYNSTVLTG